MANINLLEWRKERRKKRQEEFVVFIGIVAAIAVAVVVGWKWNLDNNLKEQNSRNQYLTSEIKKLEKKIAEIDGLKSQKQKLIDRMQAIEKLQSQRPIIVNVFTELVRLTPEGIVLTQVQNSSNQLTITGVADRSSTISEYLLAFEESAWFTNVGLGKTKGSTAKTNQNSNLEEMAFVIVATRANPEAEEEK